MDIIDSALKVYKKTKGPCPAIYEAGLRDGLRIAIAILQECSGVTSELNIKSGENNEIM